MTELIESVVFDCNIFAQAVITPNGNSGQCIKGVLDGKIRLFWSGYVLQELRRIPEKSTPKRLGVTGEQIESLIARLFPVAHFVTNSPSVFQHPADPKDSHYIDLAVASDARIIVSRDKHLLNLMNPAKQGSQLFQAKFPRLMVLHPEQLLAMLRRM